MDQTQKKKALRMVSYGLYVVHLFVHERALAALRATPSGAALLATRGGYVLYMAAGIAASAVLALASWHLVEKRFLALKARFTPGARDVAAPIAAARGSRYGRRGPASPRA